MSFFDEEEDYEAEAVAPSLTSHGHVTFNKTSGALETTQQPAAAALVNAGAGPSARAPLTGAPEGIPSAAGPLRSLAAGDRPPAISSALSKAVYQSFYSEAGGAASAALPPPRKAPPATATAFFDEDDDLILDQNATMQHVGKAAVRTAPSHPALDGLAARRAMAREAGGAGRESLGCAARTASTAAPGGAAAASAPAAGAGPSPTGVVRIIDEHTLIPLVSLDHLGIVARQMKRQVVKRQRVLEREGEEALTSLVAAATQNGSAPDLPSLAFVFTPAWIAACVALGVSPLFWLAPDDDEQQACSYGDPELVELCNSSTLRQVLSLERSWTAHVPQLLLHVKSEARRSSSGADGAVQGEDSGSGAAESSRSSTALHMEVEDASGCSMLAFMDSRAVAELGTLLPRPGVVLLVRGCSVLKMPDGDKCLSITHRNIVGVWTNSKSSCELLRKAQYNPFLLL